MPLNPNSARDEVNSYMGKSDADKVRSYPQFFMGLSLDQFRHISNVSLSFQHPITVICGSNRCGKTSALMAIACSHFNFNRHNVTNGAWERTTWSTMMRFTQNDRQAADWNYHVTYREGSAEHTVHGYRRQGTAKWGGAAKKSRQIGKPTAGRPRGGREVTFIDLNRITPGRHLSRAYYNKARNAAATNINNQAKIDEYLSYILEDTYQVKSLSPAADGQIYSYTTNSVYSSFNTASGEDVLTIMLTDILRTAPNSLILIDEIEVGLHPKIQRRLMDVLYLISQDERKQFIITTHSYAVLNSVPSESRLFLEKTGAGLRALSNISTYEALTRMDSEVFPVSTIYVEDETSKRIVERAIAEINMTNNGFSRCLRVIEVGSADKTYNYFRTRRDLRNEERISTKSACVLDGDMRDKRDSAGALKYPVQDGLFFHYSNEAPEKMLLRFYLSQYPNEALDYHLRDSNCHCFFGKMVEQGVAMDISTSFELCFRIYRNSVDGSAHFEELKSFINSLVNS